MSRLEVRLFGAPRVILDSEPVHFSRRKALGLLLYLTLQERPQSRETLGALFWPESADSRNQVRVALSLLRKLLGSEWLDDTDGTVSLAASDELWVDVLDFRAKSEPSIRDPNCVASLTGAVDLVQGGFLEGFSLRDCPEFDDWQQLEGQVLEREIERALGRLIECLEEQGDLDRALQFGEMLLARDDLNEFAYRLLMRLYARNRQIHEVKRAYDDCASHLRAQLGVRPSRETESLYRQIVRARDAQEIDRPQEPMIRPQTAIPYYGQQFFGRQEEQTELLKILGQPGCRLVTLLGTGGIGKTHLVAKASEHLSHLFEHGIRFVALDAIADADQFLPAIANVLSHDLGRGPKTLPLICSQLRDQSMLLILDNLEQLLPEVRPLIAGLLEGTSRVKVLATSRVRIGLHDEQVISLDGLDAPPEGLPSLTVQEATSFAAVQMFVYWAQKRNRAFDLSAENVQAVGALCAMVQGVPLAIRLAAAWCELLGAHELLAQVKASFELLRDELADIPERHSSARALFGSIWAQLQPAEREAFLALSVFRGGFTRLAARDIAQVGPLGLRSLLHKSLLTVGQEGRYHIHRILRFFAAERLLDSDLDRGRLHRRYVAFYARYLQERTVDLRGDAQIAATAEIDPEYRNIEHAWRLAVENRWCEAAQAMIEGLLLYVRFRGFWDDGHRLFARSRSELASVNDPACIRLRDKLTARSYMASYAALADLAAMLRTAKQSGDLNETAFLTQEMGCALRYLGWHSLAHTYFSSALDYYEGQLDHAQVADVLRAMAVGRILADELPTARDYAQSSLEISQRVGDRFGAAESHDLAAELALMLGDLESATGHVEWAYDLWQTHYGDHGGLVQARLLPWCYFFAGRLDESERLAAKLLRVSDRIAAPGDHGLVLRLLALLASAQGDTERGHSLLVESEVLLAGGSVLTMRCRLCDDHHWHLLLECAAAIIFCLAREFDRSKAITTRLLSSKMTHLRPFIVQLLFTIDLLTLYLQGEVLADEALVSWLQEQKWLRHVMS
jgi:DNA-binding SARP family transcriptional activator